MPGDQGSNPNRATKKSLLHLAATLGPGLSQACERNCPYYLSLQMLQPRRVCIEMHFHSLEVKIGVYPWRVHRANIEKLREMMYI